MEGESVGVGRTHGGKQDERYRLTRDTVRPTDRQRPRQGGQEREANLIGWCFEPSQQKDYIRTEGRGGKEEHREKETKINLSIAGDCA